MMLRVFFRLLFLLLWSVTAHGADIEGITLPDAVEVQPGTVLHLNGAGVRNKMAVVKVYVGALYLAAPNRNGAAVLEDTSAKRISMHIVADQVTAQELTSSLNSAIAANHIPAELALVEIRLRDLNRMMQSVGVLRRGAVIAIDYLPGTGTRVSIDGAPKITIPGRDFHQALMKVWLGERPVDGRLKDSMLGASGGASLFR